MRYANIYIYIFVLHRGFFQQPHYYKVTAEQQASGEVNFANGKLDSHPIATKQGADVLEALVSLTATETGDSDVVVLFEAEFSV